MKESPRKGSFTTYRVVMAALLFFTVSLGAYAFSFSPMTVSIDPSGAGAVMTYRVTNESDQQTAVAIKLMTRSIDIEGKESNQPADKLFLVFPSRVVLKPNSSQNVKVQYRGPVNIGSEQAYRVFAEQLPVDFTKSTSSGVSILLTYVAALYVSPKNVTPKVQLASAVGAEKEGQRGLLVTLRNLGTKHALIANPIVRIGQGGSAAAVEFTGDTVGGIDGQNILALSDRRFFMPWDLAVIGTAYEGSFDAEID